MAKTPTHPKSAKYLSCYPYIKGKWTKSSKVASVHLFAIRNLTHAPVVHKLTPISTPHQYSSAGAVPKLVEILATHISTTAHTHASPSATYVASDGDLVVQAAAALGSFACGSPESMSAVLQAGAVPKLIELIHSKDMHVVEAGVCVCVCLFVCCAYMYVFVCARMCKHTHTHTHTHTLLIELIHIM